MKKVILATAAALCFPASANAAIVWDWSFAGEAGTFTTDGTAVGGVAAAGNYIYTDFSVTTSALGRTIGSVSGGEYVAAGFTTNPQYDFDWDGSAVTQWNHAGTNSFNWWVFNQTGSQAFHFFGRQSGNINDATFAGLFADSADQIDGLVTVSVADTAAAVPEPATWAFMIFGFGAIGGALRRTRKANVKLSYA